MIFRKPLFLLLAFFIFQKTAAAATMKEVCSEDRACCIYTADRRAHYVRYEKCPERGPVRLTVVDKHRAPLFRLEGFINEGHSVPEEFLSVDITGRKEGGVWVTLDRDEFFSVDYVMPLTLTGDHTALNVGNPARIYLVTQNEFLFQTRKDMPFFLEAAFDYARIFAPTAAKLEIVALRDLEQKSDYFFKAAFEAADGVWEAVSVDPKSRRQSLKASAEYGHIREMELREKQRYLMKTGRLVQIRKTDGITAKSEKETFVDLKKRMTQTGWYLIGATPLMPASKNIFRVNDVIACKQPFCTEFRDPLEVIREKYHLDDYLLPEGN